jgi:hypothetical protein
MHAQRSDLSPEQRNLQVSRLQTEIEIKHTRLKSVLERVLKMSSQKPEFLRQFYDDASLTQLALSETEVQAVQEYNFSRLDKIWGKIEKE